jgi:hypothetical protein
LWPRNCITHEEFRHKQDMDFYMESWKSASYLSFLFVYFILFIYFDHKKAERQQTGEFNTYLHSFICNWSFPEAGFLEWSFLPTHK